MSLPPQGFALPVCKVAFFPTRKNQSKVSERNLKKKPWTLPQFKAQSHSQSAVTWKAFGCSSALHICRVCPRVRVLSQTWCHYLSRKAGNEKETWLFSRGRKLTIINSNQMMLPPSPAWDLQLEDSSQRCISSPPVDWTFCKPGCSQFASFHLGNISQRTRVDSFPVDAMFTPAS